MGSIARFLRACNWSIPDTVEMLTSYYKLLRKYPQFTLDKPPSELDHVWTSQINGSTVNRDQHGRRFFFCKIQKWNPTLIPIADMFISMMLIFDMLTQEPKTQISGISIVYDMQGFGVRHLR